jgi:transposase
MNKNTSYPLGACVMIDKIEKHYGFFRKVFKGIEGKMKDFLPLVKFHTYNKLTHSVSVNQMLNTYPEEQLKKLGAKEKTSKRKLYRILERVGKYHGILFNRFQYFIKENNLADKKQFIDFSSTYFEGNKAELGELGFTRDHRPGKKQITFGISTGMNDIPTALTIQKGNVQDKTHMKEMLKVIPKVIPENSILMFDAGANTKKNKKKIRKLGYHYLTRKAKKVKPYKKYKSYFKEKIKENQVDHFEVNDRHYSCVKKTDGKETLYILFCPELYESQIKAKKRLFEKNKKKGEKILKRRKKKKYPSEKGWVELIPHLQKTLLSIENPYINGIEGFLILESSVDDESEKIVRLYKQRDKAEKLIRNLKEGIELRPIRHWSKWAVIGMIFICFLANFLICLTLFLNKSSTVKNAKLLKKFLINLTLTMVYPKKRFRFSVLSNVSPQILEIFGDFVWSYQDKSLNLRW